MEKRNRRKILFGTVMSDKMEKTCVVMVIRKVRHPKYEKLIENRKKYYVHDEKNLAKIGEKVKIMECRALSKLKRWRLVEEEQKVERKP